MFVLQFILSLIFFNQIYCITRSEYLLELISEWTVKTETYQFENSSAEFKLGAESEDVKDFGNFDFIIVGAGSAGSVLATRLSEIKKWRILLLEAGGEENDFSKIPQMGVAVVFSEKNWPYYTRPQNNSCLGMINRQCLIPRGKMLGGSSSLNGVMITRGNAEDFNNWARLGNPGWSYKEVLPYFIKSENSQIDGDPGYHGIGGFLNIQHSFPPSDVYENIIDANRELNQSVIDYNGRQQIGVSKTQGNIKHGIRQSTGTAFLDNARRRSNLKVVTRALVTKILIDNVTKVTQGIEFVHNNKKFRANAQTEVILSAGVFNSAQLLILSGIGPKAHLQELEIEEIQDLPVGQNIIDQPILPSFIFRTNYTYKVTLEEAIQEYVKGLGILATPWNTEVLGFLHAGDIPDSVPMIEYMIVPPNCTSPIFPRLLNYNDQLNENFLQKVNSQTDIMILVSVLHPKSKGRISLKSKDPTDFPNIDLNYFDEPEDMDNLITGIDFVLKLGETEAFRKLNATLLDIPICQEFEDKSRSFWECVARNMAFTFFHTIASTPMGPDTSTAVVDHELRVHGIQKLRVVDAGVMPSTISGHTNAPTIMIAEKISDVIKTTYGFNCRV